MHDSNTCNYLSTICVGAIPEIAPIAIIRTMEGDRQLLEPLTDMDGYTVPFGDHVRMKDIQLPPIPCSDADRQTTPFTPAGNSILELIDSDYGSAWDFANLHHSPWQGIRPASSNLESDHEDEPNFASPLDLLTRLDPTGSRIASRRSPTHVQLLVTKEYVPLFYPGPPDPMPTIDTAVPLLDQK